MKNKEGKFKGFNKRDEPILATAFKDAFAGFIRTVPIWYLQEDLTTFYHEYLKIHGEDEIVKRYNKYDEDFFEFLGKLDEEFDQSWLKKAIRKNYLRKVKVVYSSKK